MEILKQATSGNAQLRSLLENINPYIEGKLEVIVDGKYANLLLYEGNPLENIDVIAQPQKTLKLIMKNGVIYKKLIAE
ncbi:MAG: imidazolonepropionase-like amidohydrolase [Maribacter sp.]